MQINRSTIELPEDENVVSAILEHIYTIDSPVLGDTGRLFWWELAADQDALCKGLKLLLQIDAAAKKVSIPLMKQTDHDAADDASMD